MRISNSIRAGALALGLLGFCFILGGCGDSQTETGSVVETSEDEYNQMELESESNEGTNQPSQKPR